MNELVHHTSKMSLHYLVKCSPLSYSLKLQTFPKMVGFQNIPWLCCIAATEFQASNITKTIKSDHFLCWHTLPVFVAPCCVVFQPMSQNSRLPLVNPLNFGGHQYIPGTAEARVIKFCMSVSYVKSQHKDDRVTWPTFNFVTPNDIARMAEACILHAGRLYQILTYGDKLPLKGHGQGHVTCF